MEPFPKAEELFTRAFALSDPTSVLLKLIKAHPTEAAVRELLISYIEAAENNPSRAHELASVLVALRNSPDAPVIQGGSSLAETLHNELDDLHSEGSVFDKDNETFGPTNTYLINSLLSGISFKYSLTSSRTQYSYIEDGLNVDHDSSICQLLLIGGLRPTAHQRLENRSHRQTIYTLSRIKEPNALRLLDLAISHVESGFKKENDFDNVWGLLFPSQHDEAKE